MNILPADFLAEEAVKVGALLRQEAGTFDVALPVPDVQLRVADVEVAHHQRVVAVLGELGQPLVLMTSRKRNLSSCLGVPASPECT